MSYKIKLKNKKLIKHGEEVFDKEYFKIYFKQYNNRELMFYHRWFQGWIKFINKYVKIKNGKGKTALEVGCGMGVFAKALSERGLKVTASDVSSYIIEKAQKQIEGITFRIEDIEKSKTSESFDYIFALEVLEHLKNPRAALRNMNKKLKKGGWLVFSTPYPTKETLIDPMHINVQKPDYWLKIGKDLKFESFFVRYASFLPFLYRFHPIFSIAFPIRVNLSFFVNSTCFYFFKK